MEPTIFVGHCEYLASETCGPGRLVYLISDSYEFEVLLPQHEVPRLLRSIRQGEELRLCFDGTGEFWSLL